MIRDNKVQMILRVNLSIGKTWLEALPEEWTAKYIGCRGIHSRLLFNEVPPKADPFGPDNILFIGTGPLEGTPIGMGRLSVACKSPRGTVAEGSCGGFFGPELRRAGIDYIAVQGKADRPVYLWLHDGKAEIRDARHLWGRKVNETDALLREELSDPDVQFRYIGPAGENLVHSSPIFGNRDNSGGRAGCGEVMGSKKLKAIAVRGSGGIRVADYEGFLKAYQNFRRRVDIATSRDVWTPIWGAYGAPVIVRVFNDQGGIMTRNAQEMHWDEEKCNRVSAEPYLEKYVTRAKACFCCPLPACKKQHAIRSGPFEGFRGGNLWAAIPSVFGPLLDNDDLELIIVMAGTCNQYGLDVFHVAYTLAWAMECFEKGILTRGDTDGLDLRFGCPDKAGLVELIRKIALREGFGDLLARGCAEASQIVGKGSEKFALVVKGQELEGIAHRNSYMVALGVAVSEVGPDHTRWYPPHPGHPALLKNEDLARLGVHLDLSKASQGRNPEEKGKVLRWFTISRAIVESLPSCVFLVRDTLGFDLHPWHDLFQAVTGIRMDYSEFIRAGERVMNLDRAFLVREGFRRADDRPPFRMANEDVPDFGFPKLDATIFDRMLDDYYQANGWSLKTSIPRQSKLEELGLGDMAQDLEKCGMEVEP